MEAKQQLAVTLSKEIQPRSRDKSIVHHDRRLPLAESENATFAPLLSRVALPIHTLPLKTNRRFAHLSHASACRYSFSLPPAVGERSFSSARDSIWRTRSRVTLSPFPISSRVRVRPSPSP